jgi:hypothetical protein
VTHERLADWDDGTLRDGTCDQFSDVYQIGHMLAAVPGLTAEGVRVRDRLLRCHQPATQHSSCYKNRSSAARDARHPAVCCRACVYYVLLAAL